MLGQAAAGIAGIRTAADGSLEVDDPDALDPQAAEACGELPLDAFGATLTFLDLLARRGGAPVVKLQCTGPVTFGAALVAAGVSPRRAYPLAASAARRRARALVDAAQQRLGARQPLLLVVDEPAMGAATLHQAPISSEEAVDHLSSTLASVEARAIAGVHCCAPADWSAVLRAGAAVLSVPVDLARTVRAADLGPFLDGGGWVAWGAIPTDGPLGPLDGGGARLLWRHLAQRWHALADGGVDPVLLRQRSLVTPACGLARHDTAQAELALRMTAALGERIAQGSFDAHEVSG
jgi:hypothetical protein